MNGNPRNSVLIFPGRTYSSTTLGKNSSVYKRHAGHCGSAYSMSVTFAFGEPRTRPSWGMPLRSTTGFSVAGGAVESLRKRRAMATSAAAAPIAMANAKTTVPREGRLVEPGLFVAIRPEVCPPAPFRADGTALLRDTRPRAELSADRDDAGDARDEQRQHLDVGLRLDVTSERDAPVGDVDRDAPGLRPKRPAEDVVADLVCELAVLAGERADDVGSREDSDELSVLDHRKPVDVLVDHQACRLVHAALRRDRDRWRRHRLARSLGGHLVAPGLGVEW